MRRWLPFLKNPPAVAVVRLSGIIAAGSRMGALNDQGTAAMLERAFRRGKPDAVALALNSPGGSPVQSSLIAARIRRLAEEREVKVYAFVEDVAASGGYWIAAAADEIWIDRTSIVGSIGVISAGFGLHDFIGRHGIERRMHTAGRSKSLLDPFQPEKTEDVARLRELQDAIHLAFIDHVKARRGARLDGARNLYEGDVWTGEEALDTGLADGIGHLVPKMKQVFGDKVRFMRYGPRRGLFQRLGAQALAAGWESVEERAAYARFGI